MIQDIGSHRLHNEYRTEAVPGPDDLVFSFHGKELAVTEKDGVISLPRVRDFPEHARFQYLFTLDEGNCFLACGKVPPKEAGEASEEKIPGDAALPAGCRYFSVREMRHDGMLSKELIFASFTALQLAGWYRDNLYCGSCGARTVLGKTERSIVCPDCGRAIYPRVIPAVIVGVINGDYLLHTKYERSRAIPFYALVAGFTEIGETFEQCVAREVMEETGLRVKNIRYYKSQPWGIVDDLLAGFYCDVDGDTEIHIDRSELCEGVWIHRKDIVGQPDDASLTHHMMITFKEGKEPPA